MYVCVCRAITDRQIRAALKSGASSMRDLRQQLGVCGACGKCGPYARDMLAKHTTEMQDCLYVTKPAA
jgi:bacterioferritin-associated ferredoxin